ncbi:hypothetical protein ACGFSB_16765 [Streptomyces sp. NPDC048441]|uniref:hypothetical protein n=1 Tax=Streptomyces sp. NPDC048441 TaxID=3365552 RepID=UPI00372161D8
MRIFDADRQEWVGHDQERRIAELHDRDAVRQGKALRAVVSVLAACGLVFGGWALGWKDEPQPTGYLTVLDKPPPSADPGTEGDTAAPSPTGGPPPSYEEVTDSDEGFRLAVPRGWTREVIIPDEGFNVVNYRSSDGHRRLQVYQVGEPSPYESLRTWLDEAPMPGGFDQLGSLERSDDEGRPAARLEYLADKFKGEPDVGGWHVIDHRFEASDGKLYALAAYGSEADGRDDEEELVSTALTWFCPPGETCS